MDARHAKYQRTRTQIVSHAPWRERRPTDQQRNRVGVVGKSAAGGGGRQQQRLTRTDNVCGGGATVRQTHSHETHAHTQNTDRPTLSLSCAPIYTLGRVVVGRRADVCSGRGDDDTTNVGGGGAAGGALLGGWQALRPHERRRRWRSRIRAYRAHRGAADARRWTVRFGGHRRIGGPRPKGGGARAQSVNDLRRNAKNTHARTHDGRTRGARLRRRFAADFWRRLTTMQIMRTLVAGSMNRSHTMWVAFVWVPLSVLPP